LKTLDLSSLFASPAVTLRGFLPEGERKPTLIVLPGGGYQLCAPGEGEPVAQCFANMGYAAFTLNYSVCGEENPAAVFPQPLREVALAVAHLRQNAGEYGLDTERIYLFGASAGGHLAAAYGNCWNDDTLFGDAADAQMRRPDALVLLYAATEPDQDSMMLPSVFGRPGPYSQAELDRWIVKDHLSGATPPTVLFHSAPDPMVPVRQSVNLFTALQTMHIPSELHIFGCGEHAYGLGIGTPAEVWPTLADRFLKALQSAPETFDPEAMRLHRLRRKGLI